MMSTQYAAVPAVLPIISTVQLLTPMRHLMICLLLVGLTFSGVQAAQAQEKISLPYPNQIGDIAYDRKQDDASFQVCSPDLVHQYYAFGETVYEGEKPAIVNFFRENYQGAPFKNENGYLTIRFIVNCQGTTGRYRVQGMDFRYQAKQFNKKLIDQLLELTKQLDGWKPAQYEGKFYDYYYYLTFKLINGQIHAILP